MAFTGYSTTAANNASIAGTSLQEGQTRKKDLNDQIRQIMADLKEGAPLRVDNVSDVQALNFALDTTTRHNTIVVDAVGLFYYDSTDTTSSDDGATVLVTASNERYKIFGSTTTKAPNVTSASKLTIVSGAVTPNRFAHTIETENTTSSDDLDTLTATNFSAGNSIIISAFNAARTVVVKHGTGNIILPDDTDISLDDDEKTLWLRYNGSNWIYVAGAGSAGAGSVSDTIPNAATVTELTIATGAVTPTRGTHTIDTESDAASDDLDTLTATNFSAGNILTISAANASRTVVVKHGTGNILLPNDLDISLDDAEKSLILRYDGTNWNYVAGGGISASPIIPNTATGTELTIASGVVTPTQFSHTVDTESDAASDDLDTITATNFKVGDTLQLNAESASHTVVIKHGTGNILLPDDTDISLDDTEKTVLLRYDGTNWNFVAGAGVAAGTVSATIPNASTSSELTIASGAVTPTKASHSIDTQADASSDDLDTITATNFSAGDVILIYAESATRTVTVKHGTGNILLPSDTDIDLDDAEKTLWLRYDGTNWNYVAGGGGVNASSVSAIVPNATTDSELTIATGAVTPTRAVHTIDTESDAASDDLDTITATNFASGQLLTISAESASRDVVIKHGTGNILLPNDADITLDDTEKTVTLRYDGSNWNYASGDALRPALASSANGQGAALVGSEDAGGYYSTSTVEGQLQEIGAGAGHVMPIARWNATAATNTATLQAANTADKDYALENRYYDLDGAVTISNNDIGFVGASPTRSATADSQETVLEQTATNTRHFTVTNGSFVLSNTYIYGSATSTAERLWFRRSDGKGDIDFKFVDVLVEGKSDTTTANIYVDGRGANILHGGFVNGAATFLEVDWTANVTEADIESDTKGPTKGFRAFAIRDLRQHGATGLLFENSGVNNDNISAVLIDGIIADVGGECVEGYVRQGLYGVNSVYQWHNSAAWKLTGAKAAIVAGNTIGTGHRDVSDMRPTNEITLEEGTYQDVRIGPLVGGYSKGSYIKIVPTSGTITIDRMVIDVQAHDVGTVAGASYLVEFEDCTIGELIIRGTYAPHANNTATSVLKFTSCTVSNFRPEIVYDATSLTLYGDGSAVGHLLSGDSRTGIVANSSGHVVIKRSNSERLTITGSGATLAGTLTTDGLSGALIDGLFRLVNNDQTIASGVVTLSKSFLTVQCETGTSDDIDTITLSGATNGYFALIRPKNSGETINLTESGNIQIPGGSNVALTSRVAYALLIYRSDGTAAWDVVYTNGTVT